MYEKQKEYYGEEQKKYVISLVQEQGMTAQKATRSMCEHFGLICKDTVERNYRSIISKLKPDKIEDTDEFKKAQSRQFDDSKQRFIISWAQSETPVHKEFLTNIEAYADFIGADIHMICGRYKNPSSLESSKAQEKKDKNKGYWDAKLTPYLDANRQNIHKHLTILGDVKIQPTAITPLSGLNGLTALESCIVGAPSVHLKSLPILEGYPNKLLWTTGAVTLANYTDTKAGKKGEFHHSLGFVVVELDGEDFHVRQVQADSEGNFYDLIYKTENGLVSRYNESCPAIVFGDLHLGEEDEDAVSVSFEMAEAFNVQQIILHDVMTGSSISHHEQKNPLILAQREKDGTDSLESELNNIVKWFNDRPDWNFVSVMSNHTAWIDRWILSNDWRVSRNKAMYIELAHACLQGWAPKGVLPYILNRDTTNVKSLGYNDSYRVAGWELGLHGDYAANGSRGSVVQFKNLNTKTIVGHSHTPARELGCIQVGTLTKLKLSYNSGLSSWVQSNAVIYPNGKASHINIINNKYTTLY